MLNIRLSVSLLLVLVVAACGGSPASTKYTQTWPKSYATTTCADWNGVMDQHQKFVMAGDMLLSEQKTVKPAAGIPSDALIDTFEAAIASSCNGSDQLLVSNLAVGIYVTDTQYQP